MSSPEEKAEEFLRVAPQFHLGALLTEARHPETMELSSWAQDDLPHALGVLKGVELGVLDTLLQKADEVFELAGSMRECLESGGSIFLCGCGATGRLSLSLETLWIEADPRGPLSDRVRSFMAGGDIALIRSLESFEDHPEYGARQLGDAGFGDGDLLVAITEGGETPFVVGAVEHATTISSLRPWFLYCNPDEVLIRHVERSRRVIENPAIRCLNLTAGPMTLAGSTRLQASTIQMLAAGLALLSSRDQTVEIDELRRSLSRFRSFLERLDFSFLDGFVRDESDVYKDGHYVIYSTTNCGITVLTDTTERSPTFSLPPFEDESSQGATPSLCYLSLPGAETAEEAWRVLLARDPRTLDWPELGGVADQDRLLSFDLGGRAAERRRRRLPDREHFVFEVDRRGEGISFSFRGRSHQIELERQDLLFDHILLKILLNIHSTLVMGRLGRYEGNLMTWVRPSNFKLIDRTIRYVQHMLGDAGITRYSYEQIARECFQQIDLLRDDEPIVLRTFRSLRDKIEA